MATKNFGIIILSVVLAGALGFMLGSRQKAKAPPLSDLTDEKSAANGHRARANFASLLGRRCVSKA